MKEFGGTFNFKWLLGFSLILNACAPSVGEKKTPLSFRVVKYPESNSGLSSRSSEVVANGPSAAFALSQDYCYALVISSNDSPGYSLGPLSNSTDPTCANHPRVLGKSYGLFNIGQEFETELPQGFSYNIHLLGFKKSPSNTAQYDPVPATCGGVIDLRPGALSTTNPNETKVDPFLNGLLFEPEVRLIAFNSFTSVASASIDPVVVDLLALADANGVSIDCGSSSSGGGSTGPGPSVQVTSPTGTSPGLPATVNSPNVIITGTCSNVAKIVATTAISTDLISNNSPVVCDGNGQFVIDLTFNSGFGSRVINLQGLSATDLPLTTLIPVYYDLATSGSGSLTLTSSASFINSVNQNNVSFMVSGCDTGTANSVVIQHSVAAGGPFTDISSPTVCSSSSGLTLSINASALSDGTGTNHFRARQIDSTNTERLSTPISITKDTVPPAYSGGLSYAGTTPGWTNTQGSLPPHTLSPAPSGDVAYFEVAVGTASTCTTAGFDSGLTWTNLGGTSTTFNQTVSLTLAPGAFHYLGVRPVDAAGNPGSTVICSTGFRYDGTLPSTPSGFTVTSGIDNFTYANFTWSPSTTDFAPISYYRVRATSASNGGGTVLMPWSPAGPGPSIVEVLYTTPPTLGQQVFFQIQAIDEAGHFSNHAETSVTMWSGGNWTPVATGNAPSPRSRLGWTPYEPTLGRALVFGGYDFTGTPERGDGRVFDFVNNAWLTIGGTAPTARYHHQYVLEQGGSKVWVVSGFGAGSTNLTSGKKILISGSPAWQGPLTGSIPGLAKGRNGFSHGPAIYVGFFAGLFGSSTLSTSWAATSGLSWNSPITTFTGPGATPGQNLEGHSVTRYGADDLYIFGGYNGSSYNGGIFLHNLSSNSFEVPATGAGAPPDGRRDHAAELINVMGQDRILIWGGKDDTQAFNDGGVYTINTGDWEPILPSPISGRVNFAHHWTGTHFLVWGGEDFSGNALSDGAIYNPASKTWALMDLAGAPSARTEMAFTGKPGSGSTPKLFVWGGDSSGAPLGDGAIYQPNLP